MTIIHPLDDFLYALFPKARAEGKDQEVLKSEILKFYTVGPFQPKVAFHPDFVEITIEGELIEKHRQRYAEVLKLSEKGKLEEAKKRLANLIEEAPHVSEYHRVMGQIFSEQGDQEEAINYLIDALRWDPANGWALMMMGNIFAKYRRDIDTAMTYYGQAAKANPEDSIVLSNIGVILMKSGKEAEAVTYFEKALALDPASPNALHNLALVKEKQGDDAAAFALAIEALRHNPKKDEAYQNSLRLAFAVTERLIQTGNGQKAIRSYSAELEEKSGKEVKIQEDASIPTAAKIEFAENYGRNHHLVKYKPAYPAVEHLIMHEMVHLDLVLQAREAGKNELFLTNQSHQAAFARKLAPDVQRMKKQGYGEEVVNGYLNLLFEGLNRQIYNTPIDLFIEDFLFQTYPQLRPYQFLSLIALAREGVQATTDQKILSLAPRWVVTKSKIFNLIGALHLKDLFGVNLVDEHKPTAAELNEARNCYQELQEYRQDKDPGEEYDLIRYWAEDLDLVDFFELVPEKDYRSRKSAEDILRQMEEDPYGLEEEAPEKEKDMNRFLRSHQDKNLNSAVVMYMVDALKYFEKVPKSQIKEVAHEIAMVGMTGIHPEKKGYKIAKISGKSFSGYHLLAYYYVSWALALPEKLRMLQLPLDKEYEVAKQFIRNT